MDPETGCAASFSFDQAFAILADAATPIAPEIVPLSQAAGRRLASPVFARIDAPRQDCAAMDGYAVLASDIAGGLKEFESLGTVFAGDPSAGSIGPGTTMRVMTGAPVPVGADRVVMIERCSAEGAAVRIEVSPNGKSHIRRRGSDFGVNDRLLDTGTELTPAALVVAAAADYGQVEVWRRPRVLLVVTGDELAPPGEAAQTAHDVPDSLSAAIAAMVLQSGGEIEALCRLRDDRGALENLCTRYVGDVIVVIGGAARGDRDFSQAAATLAGLDLLFADVAMKPGKPVWYGRTATAHVIGLPGNPTAAFTTARLFLAPMLLRLAGGAREPQLPWKSVPVAHPIGDNGGREAFLCGLLSDRGVTVHERQEASGQMHLARSNVIVRRPANAPAIAAGTPVSILSL